MENYRIQGQKGLWEVVVGLEVHAQINTISKLFSRSKTAFVHDPNTHVHWIDAGFPGVLPSLNMRAVEKAVLTGLALNAQIHLKSIFSRKNYFYADLPLGYQITQFDSPLVGEGFLEIDLEHGVSRCVAIERLHLEQDAGKSLHDQHANFSLIDFNRAGVPLMEIITKPDLFSPKEAAAYVKRLRSVLRYIDVCDGNMEEGSMRCDVNVSVRPQGDQTLRTRCEIKNVNSIRFMMQAIEFEAKRQVHLYEQEQGVDQETRLFDPQTGETRTMRLKENANDYRYFPEPDLLPLILEDSFVQRIKKDLVLLPMAYKKRFIEVYQLSAEDALMLCEERAVALYYEELVAPSQGNPRDAKLCANWVITNLFAVLNKKGIGIQESPISASALGELIDLIMDQSISGKIAKNVFEIMLETGACAKSIVLKQGLMQITDISILEDIIENIIVQNPIKVNEYRAGKDKLFGWFVGQVMQNTEGKANPETMNRILKEKLKG